MNNSTVEETLTAIRIMYQVRVTMNNLMDLVDGEITVPVREAMITIVRDKWLRATDCFERMTSLSQHFFIDYYPGIYQELEYCRLQYGFYPRLEMADVVDITDSGDLNLDCGGHSYVVLDNRYAKRHGGNVIFSCKNMEQF